MDRCMRNTPYSLYVAGLPKLISFLAFSVLLLGFSGIFLNAHAIQATHATSSQSHDFGDNNPDVYVSLGDSITRGYGLNNYSESYPAKLQELLGKTVINEGISGSKSYQGASRVGRVLQRHKPGYLLTLYGVNDIGERSNDSIINSLRQIIHSAKNNKTIPVIATLTPVFGSRGWKEPHLRDLNIKIRSLAKEEGILLADLEEAFAWDSTYLLNDGLHPNSKGHELMAQTFYKTLQESPSSSGGGCTFNPSAPFGYEWVLLFCALILTVVRGLIKPRVSAGKPMRA